MSGFKSLEAQVWASRQVLAVLLEIHLELWPPTRSSHVLH